MAEQEQLHQSRDPHTTTRILVRGEGTMSTLLRWQVGAVRITRVQELEAPGMRFIVPQATIDNLGDFLKKYYHTVPEQIILLFF